MPVRWVVSSPWIGWADERNWITLRSPSTSGAHVDALRPDVVHFHALQSLGAGPAAARPARPGPGWSSRCTTSGGCARGSSWSTATSSRARWWSRPACAPARSTRAWRRQRAGRAAPSLLRLGRPGAGAVGVGRPGAGRQRRGRRAGCEVDENGLPDAVLPGSDRRRRRSGRRSGDAAGAPDRCGCSTPAAPT